MWLLGVVFRVLARVGSAGRGGRQLSVYGRHDGGRMGVVRRRRDGGMEGKARVDENGAEGPWEKGCLRWVLYR
jgi:hypothetical protein